MALRQAASAGRRCGVKATVSDPISDKLSQSQILRDCELAFAEATGLPRTFAPAGKKRPGMRGNPAANECCTHLAASEPGCRMCVDMQESLAAESADGTTKSAACLAGLTHFNRMFRRIAGQSPAAFRQKTPGLSRI